MTAPARAAALATATSTSAADADALLKIVKASVKAENAKDTTTFLKLWTDKGLAEYDVGSRADVAAGKSDNFGAEPARVLKYGTPTITGNTATVELQVLVGERTFAQPLYLIALKGLKRNGDGC